MSLLRLHFVLLLALAACSSGVTVRAPGGGAAGEGGGGGSGGGGSCPDVDGDGAAAVECGGADCDDADAGIHPGADELCGDGVDQDCDGAPDGSCTCVPGDMLPCWTGDAALRGVGQCVEGFQRCSLTGSWERCEGAGAPATEAGTCDGLDADCDRADAPGCDGSCAPGAVEACGNGLDDDCSGTIDDPGACGISCIFEGDEPIPGSLACCADPLALHHVPTCQDSPGQTDCSDRVCADLDGRASTVCSKGCDDGGCICGRDVGNRIVDVPDCGFATPCARMDCDGRAGQPCYSGPPGTLGVGSCRGGAATCQLDPTGRRAWGACVGEVLPSAEVCGNGLDDDCDGFADEADGKTGRRCDGRTDCAPEEACGNGLDDDCDGFADEACLAGSERQACFTGPIAARGRGLCRDGVQVPAPDGRWSPCKGDVLPGPEKCGDGLDSDCDGLGGPGAPEDESCCTPAGIETCNDVDDDCDGLVDEGVLNHCGRCSGPCYAVAIEDPGDCSAPGRACDQILPAGATGITFDTTDPMKPLHRLYSVSFAALTAYDTSARRVAWQKTELRSTLGRVAAAPDGSVWLLDWVWNGAARLLHVSDDGRVLCETALGSMPPTPSITVDVDGTLWLLDTYARPTRIQRFRDGSVGPPAGNGGPPSCAADDLDPDDEDETGLVVDPVPVDLVAGARGNLWLVGRKTAALDTDTLTTSPSDFDSSTTAGAYPRRIVDMRGDLYFWTQSPTVLARATVKPGSAPTYEKLDQYVSGLSLGPDGQVWGAVTNRFPRQVAHVMPPGLTFDLLPAPSNSSAMLHFVDDEGGVWATMFGGLPYSLYRRDPTTGDWANIGQQSWLNTSIEWGLDTAVDVRGIASREARWSQVVDSHTLRTRWHALEFTSDLPAGTDVRILVRFADEAGQLASSTAVCGPFRTSPVDLAACTGGDAWRFARVEVRLYADTDDALPTLSDLRLSWDVE